MLKDLSNPSLELVPDLIVFTLTVTILLREKVVMGKFVIIQDFFLTNVLITELTVRPDDLPLLEVDEDALPIFK